jgi:hypothetical protein
MYYTCNFTYVHHIHDVCEPSPKNNSFARSSSYIAANAVKRLCKNMGFLIGTVVYRRSPRIFGMVVQEAPPPPFIYDNPPYAFYVLVLPTYVHRTTWADPHGRSVEFFLNHKRRLFLEEVQRRFSVVLVQY